MKLKNLKILYISFMLMFGLHLKAQQGCVTAGGDATGGGGSASYSVGQIDYVVVAGMGGKANLGLQQPFEIFGSSLVELGVLGMNAYVYPNPSNGLVTLIIENANLSTMSYSVFDLQGRIISENSLSAAMTQIDLNDLASGAYFIRLSNNHSEIKTFKIIKQ